MIITQYFNLRLNPFRKEVPLNEMYTGSDWQELHQRLQFLEKTRGIGLVIGEPGIGKSTALRRYLQSLNTSLYHPQYLALSMLTPLDFFRGLAMGLGEEPASRKVMLIRQIQRAIETLYYERKVTPVIVLDEMHLASSHLFEELRLVFNFKMDSENPFILVLAAQPPIRSKLNLNVHYPLKQRIIIKCYMQGLSKEELTDYITSRLELAGAKEQIFTHAAIEAVHAVTNGFPRIVNSIATNCLLYACEKQVRQVDEEIVYQASNELAI